MKAFDEREVHEYQGISWSIHEEKSALPAGMKLGQPKRLDDGRSFRLAKAGAVALAAGKLVGSPLDFTERENTITVAAAIGATQVTYTAVGTLVANQFADGFLVVADHTGKGLQYKIASHPAIAAAATGIITLADPIVTALDLTSDVILLPSLFTGLILNPDVVLKTVGVPPIPVTALYYFWVQTWGTAPILCGDSLGNAATERVIYPATSTGEVLATAGGIAGTEPVGVMIADSSDVVDTEYFPFFLQLFP